ncbi:MAG: hypothetical protein RJB66_526 [Pseudomonadota bacterium]|jgi:subtilisin family serine protease
MDFSHLSKIKWSLFSSQLTYVALGLVLLNSFNVQAGTFKRVPKPINGQYIVIYNGSSIGDNGSDLDDKVSKVQMNYGARIGTRWKKHIRGFVAKMSEKDAQRLATQSDVAIVEQDSIVYANTTQNGAPWGLDRIDQKSRPLDGQFSFQTTGAGTTAYVIDTGIRSTHLEFSGRVKSGYSAIDDGYGTEDCNGHGTHVAGILGGTTYGVAKDVTLVPVRVLDCNGSGSVSGVISGIEWVTSKQKQFGGAAVANLSLGGSASYALDTAVQNSVAAGVTLVVAAGNDGADACLFSPSRVTSAITVGATNSSDAREAYSNYGSCIDIFAPGEAITSAFNTSNTSTAIYSGTSMAVPHVAGAAALYLGLNPGATPSQVVNALTANATTNIVSLAGTESPNRLLFSGFIGANQPTIDTIAPTINLTSPTAGASLQGTVTLLASAQDEAGGSGMAKVEFFVDGVSVGTVTTSPFQMAWNSINAANGSHNFFAKATDVAGNLATSSTINALVSNPTTTPTPVPACSTTSQILVNPGFESGSRSGWLASSGVITSSSSAPANSGIWKAWLNGYGKSSINAISQKVTIPANACSVILSYWLRVVTAEPTSGGAKDTLVVSLNSANGTYLKTVANYSNLNASSTYQMMRVDLSAYKGQTIQIQFTGIENSSKSTSFLVDDTALTISK